MSGLSRMALLVLLAVPAGCAGIDLFGGPVREIPRDTGPLTVPPPLRDPARR